MLQIRFENYSVSHYENCSRTNQDIQKLKHSLFHMNFSNMIELTDHLELENDDYDNFPKTKKEPPPSDYFLALQEKLGDFCTLNEYFIDDTMK
jgi:hypothetical protein